MFSTFLFTKRAHYRKRVSYRSNPVWIFQRHFEWFQGAFFNGTFLVSLVDTELQVSLKEVIHCDNELSTNDDFPTLESNGM